MCRIAQVVQKFYLIRTVAGFGFVTMIPNPLQRFGE